MRALAKFLLLAAAFAMPWEFSFELEEPLGPVARIAVLLLLLAATLAVLQARFIRRPGPLQWLVLVLFLWFSASCFWTIDQSASVEMLRAYFQEMIMIWLVWELADSPRDLRMLFRAYVAGCWELALITIASFGTPEAAAGGQIRFFAAGLDPNDTARFLDFGFPLAALLADGESRWPSRILAWGYFPLGLLAVVLTASRGGFIAATIALAGSIALLLAHRPRRLAVVSLALPLFAAAIFAVVPFETLRRINTISEQLRGGNLNDRVNIWHQGWQAFVAAPVFGSGAGSFVTAAGLAPEDTAHNTALSIAVGGGLVALTLGLAVLALVLSAVVRLRGPLRLAFATVFAVWIVSSLTATLEENRITWLLFGLIAAAARLAAGQPHCLAAEFPSLHAAAPHAPRPHPIEAPSS